MAKRILALLIGAAMIFTITVSAASSGADKAYQNKADTVYGDSQNDTRDDLTGGGQSGEQDALTPDQPAVPDDSTDTDPLPTVTPDQPYVPLPDTTTACACPDGVHLEGCPFYQAGELFQQLMACTTLDEMWVIISGMTEEQYNALTEEQIIQIGAKVKSLEPEPLPAVVVEESEPPVESEICVIEASAVNFTEVAPLGAPVTGK